MLRRNRVQDAKDLYAIDLTHRVDLILECLQRYALPLLLMGGLVMTTDDTVLKTLPPLALPCILGYAIEVLFAFMDKLVKAFVGQEKNVQPA